MRAVKVGPASIVVGRNGKPERVSYPIRDGVVRYTVGNTESLRVVRRVGLGTRYPVGAERLRLMDRTVGYIAAFGAKRSRGRS